MLRKVNGPAQTIQIEFEVGVPLREIENEVIRKILEFRNGNRTRTAKDLDITSAMIFLRLGPREPRIENPKSAIENPAELARSESMAPEPAEPRG